MNSKKSFVLKGEQISLEVIGSKVAGQERRVEIIWFNGDITQASFRMNGAVLERDFGYGFSPFMHSECRQVRVVNFR